MTKREDFLVEMHTEELPPKALLKLGEAFREQMRDKLEKANLGFSDIQFFATPRRLAVLVKELVAAQADQMVERKGPALNAAYDTEGKPTKACIGFAASCGVSVDELITLKNQQGEFVGYKQHVSGKSVTELLPAMVEQAVAALPVPKRMRWGASDVQFSRPIHSVIMLYGKQIVAGEILGFKAGRRTRGHRFHAPEWIDIPDASTYAKIMAEKGHVQVDFAKRQQMIVEQINACVEQFNMKGATWFSDNKALLDEVTGLVEWPTAISGQFDAPFLELPREVLMAAMEDHQRYFAIAGADHKLLPYFITISNIASRDAKRLIHGNERVLRARLSDAAFFYAADKKDTLAARVELLKDILYQAKLGTLYDRAQRISKVAGFVAKKIGADEQRALRAGLLAKADLTTNMVGEFPELQGIMGGYYAQNDGEHADVAEALAQQYALNADGVATFNPVAQALRIADRADALVGTFGINQIPTGDKDPYGLRRAALGILRTILDGKLDIDLKDLFEYTLSVYQVKLENPDVLMQVVQFVQERLRAYYQDKQVSPDVFAAVAALDVTNPLDFDARVNAVQAFKQLNEAEALSVANKRVSNILAKYVDVIDAKKIDSACFESKAEEDLATQLDIKSKTVTALYEARKYNEALLQLAELRKPVDDFFDQVMVMTEDKSKRENRILMLGKLRSLFLHVADIALLQ